jgi:uncharacterized protein
MMSDAARAPGAPQAFGFFETLGVMLAIYVAFAIGGWLTAAALIVVHNVLPTVSSEELSGQASWNSVALLGGFSGALAVIWLAVRRAGWQVSDYLALTWPGRGELAVALIVMFIVLHLLGFARAWLGTPTDIGIVTEYQSARSSGSLFVFLATMCVGAPIVEEFAVRGFLFRGWSESFLRPSGAIVLTSVLWAVSHTQYDWSGRFEIFVMGLVLGYFRFRSGSTYLAVVVHSAVNLYVMFYLGLALSPA